MIVSRSDEALEQLREHTPRNQADNSKVKECLAKWQEYLEAEEHGVSPELWSRYIAKECPDEFLSLGQDETKTNRIRSRLAQREKEGKEGGERIMEKWQKQSWVRQRQCTV